MRLVSIDVARTAQLFVPDEVKPRSGLHFSDLMGKIKDRYDFFDIPQRQKNADGLKFESGRFEHSDTPINIAQLILYSDGVLVEAPTTDDANTVLDEFLPWLQNELDFGDVPTKLPRTYISGLVVDFDQRIDSSASIFEQINSMLRSLYHQYYDINQSVALNKLAFCAELPLPRTMVGPEFTIERRIDTKQEDNRFYSASPFPTQEHIRLLENFERSLVQ